MTRPAFVDEGQISGAVNALLRDAGAVHPVLVSLRASADVPRARADASGRREPIALSAGLSEAPFDAPEQGNLRLEAGRELGGARRLQAERQLAQVDVRGAEATIAAASRALGAERMPTSAALAQIKVGLARALVGGVWL